MAVSVAAVDRPHGLRILNLMNRQSHDALWRFDYAGDLEQACAIGPVHGLSLNYEH